MPSLLILLPFLSIIILNLPFKNIMRRAAFWVVLFLSIFQVVITVVCPLELWNFERSIFSRFFAFGFAVDNLTLIVLASIGIVLFASLLAGQAMFKESAQKFNFINLLLTALLAMNVTVMASDIFSIYVFIEVTSITSFILISMTKDKLAVEGAFKYLILSAVATVFILCSLGLLLLFCGGTSFENIIFALQNSGNNFLLKTALGLLVCGLFIKAGLVPFHGWLPDAYSSASAPVSVLLAGIITKVCGVYVLLRLSVSVFGGMLMLQKLLMFIGAVSIVLGAVLALTQNNFKRLLSYSSISHVGYIILAAGCGTPLAVFGAAFHFFNHAVFKSLLFLNAASVEQRLGTQDIDKMGGVAHKMPVTGTTSIIGFLSAAGIPPLAGFWSKLLIIMALWKAGNVVYAGIAIFASVITLGYLLYLQRQVFFGKLKTGFEKIEEASLCLRIAQITLAAIIVATGLAFPWILKWR